MYILLLISETKEDVCMYIVEIYSSSYIYRMLVEVRLNIGLELLVFMQKYE